MIVFDESLVPEELREPLREYVRYAIGLERTACAEICVEVGTAVVLRDGSGPVWKKIRDRILARTGG